MQNDARTPKMTFRPKTARKPSIWSLPRPKQSLQGGAEGKTSEIEIKSWAGDAGIPHRMEKQHQMIVPCRCASRRNSFAGQVVRTTKPRLHLSLNGSQTSNHHSSPDISPSLWAQISAYLWQSSSRSAFSLDETLAQPHTQRVRTGEI